MIVIDASAVVDLLVSTGKISTVVAKRIDVEDTVFAPVHFDYEVAKVIRRLFLSQKIDRVRADAAMDALPLLPIARFELLDLLPRVWSLRDNAFTGDALYLALAEKFGCPLVTTDSKLSNTPGHHAVIEYLTA
ncbi:type II toxin-antitoxin system VapC family toxin [Streptomyces katrae]|uniref:Ribonuclease VapC n=1 Tax=Streptomyces katrae TaxID=68223 RepID=A0A0F4JW02_9ACTN|nr:type II toxin-antitoxin system VapC family toxin [Streptomyces katrae]KJY37156.1 hypothetical protein VR44_06440 [Streptomyces katrae]